MNVLVFRTNMACETSKQLVANALYRFGSDLRWNADLEDCEKILRVETSSVVASDIICAMNDAGFVCEELF